MAASAGALTRLGRIGVETASDLKAGSDDLMSAGSSALSSLAERQAATSLAASGAEATAKAAGEAAARTALGGAASALGGMAAVDLGAQAVAGVADLVDPTHEARSAKGGVNAVSQAAGGFASAIDAVGDAGDAAAKKAQDAASKVPVLGPVMGAAIGASRMVSATAQNVVVSASRHVEEASNAIGNEAVGARSTHSGRLDEEDVLDTDDWADAMRKGGVTGLVKKAMGDTKTESESLDDAARAGAEWLDSMHESGTLTDAEVEHAGRLLATDKSAFVETVESIRRGNETASEAFGGRGLADAPEGPTAGTPEAQAQA